MRMFAGYGHRGVRCCPEFLELHEDDTRCQYIGKEAYWQIGKKKEKVNWANCLAPTHIMSLREAVFCLLKWNLLSRVSDFRKYPTLDDTWRYVDNNKKDAFGLLVYGLNTLEMWYYIQMESLWRQGKLVCQNESTPSDSESSHKLIFPVPQSSA